MSMTKKDYELIASAIKGRRDNTWQLDKFNWTGNEITAGIAVLDGLVWSLASDLARDNRKFDIDRFVSACGIPDGTRRPTR